MLMRIYFVSMLPFYLVVSLLLLISLYNKETVKQKLHIVIILLIAVVAIAYQLNNTAIQRLLFFVLHGFILLRVIHMMGLDLIKTQSLNGFLVALVFYELLTLTKFFNILVKVADLSVLTNFYFVTIVQILLGIFFTVFKEDNRRIRVRLE
ncbi:MAG: hypothetical protein AMXMBFR48_28520 [Ignavibacteriales bacterium]